MVKKKNKLFKGPLIYTLLSILMGILIGAIILLASGYNPIEVYGTMLYGIFGKPKFIAYTIIKATPLIITGLSVAFAFKTGLFNIGAEGQFIIGALVAALVGYFVHLPLILHILLILTAAALAAGLWGALAGFLKSKFGINEVISTIMLNWIALYLSNYIIVAVNGFKKPNIESTFKIQTTAMLNILGQWKMSEAGRNFLVNNQMLRDIFKAPINAGIIIALILVFVIRYILNETSLGYQLRAVGLSEKAAEYAGIDVNKKMIISMAIAGAIAGIGGAVHIMGVNHSISILSASEGYGFNGIAVSLIGLNNPIGCIFGALLFGGFSYGGPKVQQQLGTPTEIINIVIGIVILFISMPKIFEMFKAAISKKRGGNHAK